MRSRPEALLILALSVFATVGLTATFLMRIQTAAPMPYAPILVDPVLGDPGAVLIEPAPVAAGGPLTGSQWFDSIRRYCNPVEVETQLRWQPAPDSEDGTMHEAACYALAGKIDQARSAVLRLPEERRYHAAGVIFNAGHPAADAGDELAAGPLMELVVEFWPNHYMALYHAGAAAHERGDRLVARGYLESFLQEYSMDDGWRSSAIAMLESGRR